MKIMIHFSLTAHRRNNVDKAGPEQTHTVFMMSQQQIRFIRNVRLHIETDCRADRMHDTHLLKTAASCPTLTRWTVWTASSACRESVMMCRVPAKLERRKCFDPRGFLSAPSRSLWPFCCPSCFFSCGCSPDEPEPLLSAFPPFQGSDGSLSANVLGAFLHFHNIWAALWPPFDLMSRITPPPFPFILIHTLSSLWLTFSPK